MNALFVFSKKADLYLAALLHYFTSQIKTFLMHGKNNGAVGGCSYCMRLYPRAVEGSLKLILGKGPKVRTRHGKFHYEALNTAVLS